jgi:transposase-like protein
VNLKRVLQKGLLYDKIIKKGIRMRYPKCESEICVKEHNSSRQRYKCKDCVWPFKQIEDKNAKKRESAVSLKQSDFQ